MWTTGKIIERTNWNDKLFSLHIEADVETFKAGQYIKLGLELEQKKVPRAYSLVSAPHEPLLEVLLISVENGKLSPELAALNAGDEVLVSGKAGGFMTMDEVPSAKQLWMLATGTAVGPYISMLRTEQPWTAFEKIILCYGVRYQEDLAYFQELQGFQNAFPDRFQLITSVTRQKGCGQLDSRLSDALLSGQLEESAQATIDTDSQVMLCGNPEMVADIQQHLLERGLRKNLKREPGHITVERYW
ncbi:ferredoxin--NADP reductase [Aliiglaciecola sp. CAU 1673]|uniref:ferredoxin--NADP reductase n=1 Tax=Aliiglaciecola sp. CAU 1673 TaxID=3032595 RepID=UPI0023DB5321|nr:ferredoxin--NADP reductase [Aliiglaciecola sp. CAU 1673]MDF2177205.1 ferredoxin--NADP reductase [Aliiglaciecola sp. CAU 1673]